MCSNYPLCCSRNHATSYRPLTPSDPESVTKLGYRFTSKPNACGDRHSEKHGPVAIKARQSFIMLSASVYERRTSANTLAN